MVKLPKTPIDRKDYNNVNFAEDRPADWPPEWPDFGSRNWEKLMQAVDKEIARYLANKAKQNSKCKDN